MATVSIPRRSTKSKQSSPLLNSGDRLDQKTFHALYEACPPGFKAELIGGVVHVPSPMKRRHGRYEPLIAHWLTEYTVYTPGVEVLQNVTTVLGPESEPQPDACLLILPEYGGQVSEDEDGYVSGPPELVAQISDATESLDLNQRKRDFERVGVREYLVIALRRQKVLWFSRRRRKLKELPVDPDGILRSETFPGLWLDPAALIRREVKRVSAVLGLGLASSEHAAFVAKLAKRST